jgi:protein TonB
MISKSIGYGSVAIAMLCALLGAYAQQPSPTPNCDHPIGESTATIPPATQTPTGVVDGILACPADRKPQPLPDGVYRVGGPVKPPRPTQTSPATFSDEVQNLIKKRALRRFQAESLLALTVNLEGIPQDICVMRQAGYGLDKQAFHAVEKYRFQPATLNGKPVAVRIVVGVNFKSY